MSENNLKDLFNRDENDEMTDEEYFADDTEQQKEICNDIDNIVPEEDSIDIYYQMKGYPMIFAYGVPYPEEHWEEVDPDDLFMMAWDNFEFYEEDMFK